MPALEFFQFFCRDDNFGVLIHSPQTGETAAIDAPDGAVVARNLAEKGWRLTHIFVTHHHGDHVEGIPSLKKQSGCTVLGPDNPRIGDIDRKLSDGDTFDFAGEPVEVIATPGHTLDMLNYYLPRSGVVFTGDTLFAMGCGRVVEGTYSQMWDSLSKLMKLPRDTRIYCGHEYTLANGRFALTIDPDNAALARRVREVEQLRAQDKPALPTTLELELATNPFLRASDPAIRKHLGMENASDAEVFAEIRKRKDRA